MYILVALVQVIWQRLKSEYIYILSTKRNKDFFDLRITENLFSIWVWSGFHTPFWWHKLKLVSHEGYETSQCKEKMSNEFGDTCTTKPRQKSFYKIISSMLVRYINPKRWGGKQNLPQDHDITIKFTLLICTGVLFGFWFCWWLCVSLLLFSLKSHKIETSTVIFLC